MQTLLLDDTYWDLLTDINGNIAVASEPYALAQDVASAIKLFLGELWYNVDKGIPYFEEVLAHAPPLSVVRQYIVRAALTVPGVVSAVCIIQSFQGRTITGECLFIDTTGAETRVRL